jgi:hypothetical protein
MSDKSSQDHDGVSFVLEQHAEFEVYIVLAHWNNSQWVDMLDHRAPYFLCMSVKSSQDHDGVCFVLDQHAEFEVYIVLAQWNNSPWVDMLDHRAPFFLCMSDKSSQDHDGVCSGSRRWAWGLYSPSSLKQQSVSRYVGPPGTLFFVHVDQTLTRWWWCLLCTGPIRWVWGLYSPSSLKQQSVSRHVAPPGTLFFVYVGQKLTRSWWCLLCTGPTCWVWGLYIPSSLKQQSVSRHVAPPYFLCMSIKSSQNHDGVCFVLDQYAEFEVYIVLTHWNNSSWVDMLHHRAPYFCVCRSKAHKMMMVSALYLINTMSWRFI